MKYCRVKLHHQRLFVVFVFPFEKLHSSHAITTIASKYQKQSLLTVVFLYMRRSRIRSSTKTGKTTNGTTKSRFSSGAATVAPA